MRAAQIITANRIVLGWSLPPFSATHFFDIVLHAQLDQTEERSGCPECTRTEFLRTHSASFRSHVLLAWNLFAVRAALRRLMAETPGAWLPPAYISLQSLAQNLLGLSRKPALPSLYQQLTGVSLRSESWEHQLRAQTEIWEALQAHCREHRLQDWKQVANFARRALPPDFSQYEFDEKLLANLPETPGVYVMKDRAERVIYVGKAANLKERVHSYFLNDFVEEVKLREIRARIVRLHYELHDTELDALLREQSLISRFRPPLNRQIMVHPQTAPQSKKMHGIYLVPMRTSLPAKTKGRVIIYFLSPQSLQRLPVNLARIPKRRICKVLEAHLQQCAKSTPMRAPLQARLEIASRWLHHNRAWISTLATHEGDHAEEIAERLLRLLRAPEILHERVESE